MYIYEETKRRNKIDIDLIEEVLAFTRNVGQAYKEAEPFLKRHYLRFFFERIMVKNKEVVDLIHPPIIAALQANREVIIRKTQLENRNSNMTTQLSCIFKTFEDFRLVQQIREEIEKVKPSLLYAV